MSKVLKDPLMEAKIHQNLKHYQSTKIPQNLKHYQSTKIRQNLKHYQSTKIRQNLKHYQSTKIRQNHMYYQQEGVNRRIRHLGRESSQVCQRVLVAARPVRVHRLAVQVAALRLPKLDQPRCQGQLSGHHMEMGHS